MRLAILLTLLAFASSAAQPPGRGGSQAPADPAATVERLFGQFDADKDGKLTRAELTDARFAPLFESADADKDGVLTKAELTAHFAKQAKNQPAGGRGGPGMGGPGGPGGMGAPGQVLPEGLQRQLQLTDDQKKQVAELQKLVDAKIASILTAEQRAQLAALKSRGPGGGRGPGGPPPN